MARHLIVTGAIGCVIVDDVPGLDVGAEQERLGRAKALATFSQCLGSVATAHDCRVILIDRAGGFRHERAPLGYRDYFAPLAAA
jgi:hypothetical protein